MQKRNDQNLKKVNKNKLNTLDRFLNILWKKEVEYKVNI